MKQELARTALILLYGFPGSGKTFFARQFCDDFKAAHVQDDRIRNELFENPRYDKQENQVVNHLMTYMAEEFLEAGVSVVFDTNAMRVSQRRKLRELARKSKARCMLIWSQIDTETAFTRTTKRDRRKSDDKYAQEIDRAKFDAISQNMQNPEPTEDYVVISGKHTFKTQRHMVAKKMYDIGLISPDLRDANAVKPGMVNLVPPRSAGRVDSSRRNISIR
ncbi:MAG: ATP-binding protein [Candidatus Saccharibacteria bacterium]|nr:ATP-binding protein [Candidatus Saccharibacteria bacterium]